MKNDIHNFRYGFKFLLWLFDSFCTSQFFQNFSIKIYCVCIFRCQ